MAGSLPTDTTQEASETTSVKQRVYPRVWYLIPARFLCVVIPAFGLAVAIVGSSLFPSIGYVFNYTGTALIAVGGGLYLLSLAAVVGVYLDRKRLDTGERWCPSHWYYLLLYPGFIVPVPLAALYTYRRLKYVGSRSRA